MIEMGDLEKELEEIKEYLVPVGKEKLEEKLQDKFSDLKKKARCFYIKSKVGRYYDCEPHGRGIDDRVFSPPAGSRPASFKLQKLGFEDYGEFLHMNKEERQDKIRKIVRSWVIHSGAEGLKRRIDGFETDLPDDDFLKIAREYKKKIEILEELESGIIGLTEYWGHDEDYERLSDERKREVDEKVEELIDRWVEKYGR